MPRILKSRLLFVAVLLGLKVLLARVLLFGTAAVLQPGTVADVCALVLLAALVALLPRRLQVAAYVVVDVVVSVALLAIVMHARYFGNVPALASVLLLRELVSLPTAAGRALRPQHLFLFADIPVLALALALHGPKPVLKRRTIAWVAGLVAFVLALGMMVDAVDVTPTFAESVLRHGIIPAEVVGSMMRIRRAEAAVNLRDPVVLQQMIDRAAGSKTAPDPLAGVAKGRNLIVVQVESLQEFALGRHLGTVPLTPHLDALAAESIDFPDCYTQISAGNTSDAEYVVNTSLYPRDLLSLAIAYSYTDRRFPSLPRLLEAHGYGTMTFHANKLSFWNRENLYPALGFGKAYPLEFFGDEDVIGMGPSDDVLFAKARTVLEDERRAGRPFYAQLVTLTSHYPFELPADKEKVLLPAGYRGSLVGRYLAAVAYDDAAIGDFVDALKRDGLWDDSVVVVYGDHGGLPSELADSDRALLAAFLGRMYGEPDRFNIPLLIHVPGVSGRVVNRSVGQVDILPTVASLLGVPLGTQVHFGRDALAPGTGLLGFRWNEAPTYADGPLFVDSDSIREAGGVYDAHTKERIAAKPPADERDRVRQLEALSDAYVDSLPRR